MNWKWIILLLPLASNAQRFSKADLSRIKMYASGHFTNEMQVKKDNTVPKQEILVQPIFHKRKDGVWMMVTKKDTAAKKTVWHFYLQDDSTLLLQLFAFKKIQQGGVTALPVSVNALLVQQGCEMYFRREKGYVYTGTTSGKDCRGPVPPAEYRSRTIRIERNTLVWQEQGFNADEKQVYDTGKAGIIFERQTNKVK